MHFPDLSQDTQIASGPFVRAIGWLGAGHLFPRGPATSEFLVKLRSYCAAWSKSTQALGWPIAMGPHTCEFCGTFRASGNLGVPGGDILFVAPEMLAHYVEVHSYAPPDEFVKAVVAAPLPGTAEYDATVRIFVIGGLPSNTSLERTRGR